MDLPSLALHTGPKSGHDHLVEFYETEAFLVDTVAAFLLPALRGGDAAIVVATAAHRREFDRALGDAGIDIDAAAHDGRFLAFDAAGLLSGFMVDGQPDAHRFRETIGAIADRASQGGRRIRVYGEMVALLWDDGDVHSALALEDLWNGLAEIRPFQLLCAYPMRAFIDEASTAAFKRICAQHTTIIPSESYSLLADPAAQSRAVAQLQQQAAALHPEILRLRDQQERDGAGPQSDDTGDQRDQAGDQRDQAGDQRDQAGDQRDQAGVQRDQAGVQRDQAGDRSDEAGVQRDQAGDQRDEAGVRRDQAAEQRDAAAGQRDLAAAHRDRAAEQRDRAAEQRDRAAERYEASLRPGITSDPLNRHALARRDAAGDRSRASQDRRAGAGERTDAELDRATARADRGAGAGERTHAEHDRGTALADRGAGAGERTQAEHDRGTALADRGAGAGERTQAELDRGTALADRGASAREREDASVDDLTGVYLRGAGFIELDREMARARRTRQPLVLAFVDVDRLKTINDSRGHAAGDLMLLEVANTLRAKLRSYDLIFRYGGDEFVCAISAPSMADAMSRLALVNASLAQAPHHGSVTFGLAELRADDSPADLVARADAALYRERQQRRSAHV